VSWPSDANDEVIAEYVVFGLELTELTEEELEERMVWRLRVTQFSQRPFCWLQRPRQPRS